MTLVLPEENGTGEIQGTVSEALDTVEATIDRLNRLGATIRRYSTADLENRVKAFTERHGDGNYFQLARQIVYFRYRTPMPSLLDQLAVSMANRRQRLRYIRRHQMKLGTPKTAVSQPKEHAIKVPPTTQLSGKDIRGSVISSSRSSTAFITEDLDGFPDPPKMEGGIAPPSCPFCGKPLTESDLKPGGWHRHVLEDVQPFICISEKCAETSRPFKDFALWAKHMREAHSVKWTEQVHKPIVWRCDVDHVAETFENEVDFREHLNAEHSEYTPAQQEAIYMSSKVTRRRLPNLCPICNADVVAAGSSRETTNDQLTKHIASHLRRLAFDSANNLDTRGDETASVESAISSNGKNGDGSKLRPASGVTDLLHVPLTFDDSTALKLRTETTEFDSDWTPADLEVLGSVLDSVPEKLSSTDILDWSVVIAKLKEDMKPEIFAELEHGQESESSDIILQHL
ncbi:hypothetical protein C8A01DRAFT_20125, partial [Parachaetomium inaequale]